MSWFCTEMSSFIQDSICTHSFCTYYFALSIAVAAAVVVNIYLRRFIVTIIAIRHCWIFAELWNICNGNSAFSSALKMANMNNHMIIFLSSPFCACCELCALYICAHYSMYPDILFPLANKYANMLPCGKWKGLTEWWLQLMVYDLEMVLWVLWILLQKESNEIGESTV